MTDDQLIQMAKEAFLPYEYETGLPLYIPQLKRFAALVISSRDPQSSMAWQEGFEAGKQLEREACAKVCEKEICNCCWDNDAQAAAEHLAAAIRARGGNK